MKGRGVLVPNAATCTWWRHPMETFSALLAICAGNSPVTGEFSAKRPVTRSFDVSFDLRLNKRLSKQLWAWWFETPLCPLWRHCNVDHQHTHCWLFVSICLLSLSFGYPCFHISCDAKITAYPDISQYSACQRFLVIRSRRVSWLVGGILKSHRNRTPVKLQCDYEILDFSMQLNSDIWR